MSEHCILVIEDQEDFAELYETTLKKAGYDVRNAYTGEEGIAEFKASGADLVVLDMTLPEMHGTQVLRELRDINASVPVIIVTGESGNLYRDQCERLGVYGYLAKPPNYDALLGMIENALEAPPEEAKLVTLRLPTRILAQLYMIDPNLERAITQLCDERQRQLNRAPQARAATAKNPGAL